MRDVNQNLPVLRPARPEDAASVLALLTSAGLPVAGVEAGIDQFVVAECADGIVGVAGLERYGTAGLLRSVAVADVWRGRGHGAALCREILEAARQHGLTHLYLLTETAADFFPRFGFHPIRREDASQEIEASEEFRGLCPASSTVMVLTIAVAP